MKRVQDDAAQLHSRMQIQHDEAPRVSFNLASVVQSVGKKKGQIGQDAVAKAEEHVSIEMVAKPENVTTGHDAGPSPSKKRKAIAQRANKGFIGGPSRALDVVGKGRDEQETWFNIAENLPVQPQESEIQLSSIQQVLQAKCGQDWSEFGLSTAKCLRSNLISRSDRNELFTHHDSKDMIDIAVGRILSSFTALDLAVEYQKKVIAQAAQDRITVTQTELLVQAEKDATDDRVREVTRVKDEEIAKLTSELSALNVKLKKVEDENDSLKQGSAALQTQANSQEAAAFEAKKKLAEARRAHEVEMKDMEEELSSYLSVQKEGMAKYLALKCPELPMDFFDEYDVLDDLLKKKAEIDQKRQAERGQSTESAP